MYYHIILTEKCNSRCKYCYEKSMNEFENGLEKKWKFERTPVDSQVKIEQLKKLLRSSDTLIFYGGEPLLMLEKIKEIIDTLNCRFCMQTNGKLLDQAPRKYLKKISKILISIDGRKKITDYNKGEGTYDLVLKNAGDVRKKGFGGELVARMAVSQEFPDVFLEVKHLISLGKFDSIHWQIDAGFYKNDFNFEKFSNFVREYNESVTNLVNYWLEEMKKGRVLKLYPFLGLFESLYCNKPSKLRCGSGHSNYTITTSGKLSACPIMNNIKDFYCGDTDSGIKKKIEITGACVNCKYLGLCGGRCLYSNYANLWPKEGQELVCKTIKHLIHEIKRILPEIKKLLEKKIIKESDFIYEKYFGPEIIP